MVLVLHSTILGFDLQIGKFKTVNVTGVSLKPVPPWGKYVLKPHIMPQIVGNPVFFLLTNSGIMNFSTPTLPWLCNNVKYHVFLGKKYHPRASKTVKSSTSSSDNYGGTWMAFCPRNSESGGILSQNLLT